MAKKKATKKTRKATATRKSTRTKAATNGSPRKKAVRKKATRKRSKPAQAAQGDGVAPAVASAAPIPPRVQNGSDRAAQDASRDARQDRLARHGIELPDYESDPMAGAVRDAFPGGEYGRGSFEEVIGNSFKGGGPGAELESLLRQQWSLVSNQIGTRMDLIRTLTDPRRDIDKECGHPRDLTLHDYYQAYSRDPIAHRIVDLFPDESWIVEPTVQEDENVETSTAFEEALANLAKTMRGGSWLDTEDTGNPIWEVLHRVDKQSGIGAYGAILVGRNDGMHLHEPAYEVGLDGVPKPSTTEYELTFLRTLDERLARVSQYENDHLNARFGLPVMYEVTFWDPDKESVPSSQQPLNQRANVHWTRMVHIADNLSESEVFGTPRLQVPFNRYLDLDKLYSGSGEMYWRGAFPGLSIESHPSLGPTPKVDKEKVKEQMEQYMEGLQRYLNVIGVSVKSLAPQVVDPTPQIERYIEAICIMLGIPKRIFMGSERGELASSQDAKAWNSRISARQTKYLTPRVVAPFIDKLVILGILPQPEKYTVKWPDLTSLSEQEQVEIALKRTEAMAKYSQSDADVTVMAPVDFIERVLGFSNEEAEEILENVEPPEPALTGLGDIEAPNRQGGELPISGGDNNATQEQGTEQETEEETS